MSTAVLCNKLVPGRCGSCLRLVRRSSRALLPRHCSGDIRSISWLQGLTASQLPKLSIQLLKILGDSTTYPLPTPRICRRFVRKLKITAGGAVPFCKCDVVLINSVEQPALGLQKSGLSHAVLKRRDQTGCNIFPNGAGTLLRGGRRGCERCFAGSNCLKVVGDPRQFAAHVRLPISCMSVRSPPVLLVPSALRLRLFRYRPLARCMLPFP